MLPRRIIGNRRRLLMALGIGAAAVLAYPRKVHVAPRWTIEVVDERGRPVRGVQVSEVWGDYDVEGGQFEDKWSDESGLVVFPERTTRVPLVWTMASRVAHVMSFRWHSSVGPHASVGVHCGAPGSAFDLQAIDAQVGSVAEYRRVVVKGGASCPSGGGGRPP